MNRCDYFKAYHAKNRDKRRAQMLARYYALGGHKGRLIKELQNALYQRVRRD
jgi:hypothetical protein